MLRVAVIAAFGLAATTVIAGFAGTRPAAEPPPTVPESPPDPEDMPPLPTPPSGENPAPDATPAPMVEREPDPARASQLMERLRENFNDENDTTVLTQVALEVVDLGRAAVPALRAHLNDQNRHMRAWAAWILTLLGDQAAAAKPELLERRTDPEYVVRHWVGLACRSLEGEHRPIVISMLQNQHVDARRAALRVVATWNPVPPEAVTELRALVGWEKVEANLAEARAILQRR